MALKSSKKRPAQPTQGPSKKRKVGGKDLHEHGGNKKAAKEKTKEKAKDKGFIPIPNRDSDDDVDLSDEDLAVFEEFGNAAAFLNRLDEKGISRSKKETERLHLQTKPVRVRVADDLPAIDSHDEGDGDEDWSSGIDDDDLLSNSDASDDAQDEQPLDSDSDAEMPYETVPRKRRSSWEPESAKDTGISRLPIKLASGHVQKSSEKVFLPQEKEESEEEQNSEFEEPDTRSRVEDVSTGARFGRPAVIDVIGNKSRKARMQGAKEQIAGICQEIVSDPENSMGLLRRLHTFSLPEISTPSHPEPVPNDPVIRKLTILSQLAVFKDIIPGYRIRALTELEKTEKVSQMVQRTRDWEQGLVGVYQSYLRILEAELKSKSELSEIALQCMCTLLAEATHFNFRVNLMGSIVASLSKKSWDKMSDICLNTLIKVFRADLTGDASLEIVRLLNRMIKERKYNVHPEVLSCLLYLRLKTELGVRASESKVDREDNRKSRGRDYGKGKGKKQDKPHLSKKAKKVLKERKEIQKEMHEAEAEVDKDERAATQTETLKLLFVLYFRILKNPHPTPLLPAALQGISKFSHLVNIDFFKDLMKVLKDLMLRDGAGWHGVEDDTALSPSDGTHVRHQLLCIVTAFELLTGQGEALDIDLSDFITRLYGMITPLSLTIDIETPPPIAFQTTIRELKSQSTADMFFRAMELSFSAHTNAAAAPPWRSAAFAKRLLTAALQWPSASAIRALKFVGALIERDPKLEALLSTEDRSVNGVYRPDLEDPQLSNPFGASFWELQLLLQTHWDPQVRKAAHRVLHSKPGS